MMPSWVSTISGSTPSTQNTAANTMPALVMTAPVAETARTMPSQGTLNDLWAKALVLEDPRGRRVVLVTMDLVGIDRDTSVHVRDRIQAKYKLGRADVFQTELSGDGLNLVTTKYPSNRKTVVTVRSATTGATVATRSFKGYASALDADTDRVLVGGQRKTWLWTTSTNSVGIVARDAGYTGDLSADVLAGYTKDPYLGGCTVVRTLWWGGSMEARQS